MGIYETVSKIKDGQDCGPPKTMIHADDTFTWELNESTLEENSVWFLKCVQTLGEKFFFESNVNLDKRMAMKTRQTTVDMEKINCNLKILK
jgi:hypothetical protein